MIPCHFQSFMKIMSSRSIVLLRKISSNNLIYMSNSIYPFHLAIPVDDLATARHFYHEVLQCKEGRTSELWTDYDLYGHQLVIHYQPKSKESEQSNPVDGHDVPVPHFGVVLPRDEWESLAQRV